MENYPRHSLYEIIWPALGSQDGAALASQEAASEVAPWLCGSICLNLCGFETLWALCLGGFVPGAAVQGRGWCWAAGEQGCGAAL